MVITKELWMCFVIIKCFLLHFISISIMCNILRLLKHKFKLSHLISCMLQKICVPKQNVVFVSLD